MCWTNKQIQPCKGAIFNNLLLDVLNPIKCIGCNVYPGNQGRATWSYKWARLSEDGVQH